MKTIAQWNAEKAKAYRPPKPYSFKPVKPRKIGAACKCGKPLFEDVMVMYGNGPFYSGIVCPSCGQKGYIKEWMSAPEIVLI